MIIPLKYYIFKIGLGNQCPQGWMYYSSKSGSGKCYSFVLNGAEASDWISADHYCTAIGASLLEVESADEQFILSTHFNDWKNAGVTDLWLGIRCKVLEYGGYSAKWVSHSTDSQPIYNQWADDEPADDCDGRPLKGWLITKNFVKISS